MIVQNLIEPIGNVPNPLKYEEVVEINFEQGLLRGEMNHSSKVSILRSILDEMLSKITDDPSELPDKLSQWISSPEQLQEQESEKFRRYFDEQDRLEWSFVEGYEQQPSLWTEHFYQNCLCFHHRLSPMAQAVFFIQAEFCRCLSQI